RFPRAGLGPRAPDLGGDEEPVRRVAARALLRFPAGTAPLGLPVRDREHAPAAAMAHACRRGTLLRREPANAFPDRGRLVRVRPVDRGARRDRRGALRPRRAEYAQTAGVTGG